MNGILSCCTLTLLVAAGAATSWTDIRKGKIHTRHLKFFLMPGLLLQSAAIVWFLAVDPCGNFFLYPGYYLSNAFFSLFTGVCFWLLHLWAAGDVKLFFVFSLLLPPVFFTDHAPGVFPGFEMLANMFFLATAYVIVEAAAALAVSLAGYKKRKFQSKRDLNIKLFIKKSVTSVLIIVFFVLIVNQIRDLLVRHIAAFKGIDIIYFYMIILFLSGTLVRFLQNALMLILIAGMLIAYLIYHAATGNPTVLQQLGEMLLTGLAIAGGSMLLNYILSVENDRDIDKDDLQPSMILSDHVRQLLRKDDRLKHIDRELMMDGLQPEHIALIREHCPLEKIRIKSGFPFAPFMFAGILLTLLTGKNLLKLLLEQFR